MNEDTRMTRSLAASIITQAIEDYQKALDDQEQGIIRKEYNLNELQKFFNSEWCELLCDFVGIGRTHILAKVKEMEMENQLEKNVSVCLQKKN